MAISLHDGHMSVKMESLCRQHWMPGVLASFSSERPAIQLRGIAWACVNNSDMRASKSLTGFPASYR